MQQINLYLQKNLPTVLLLLYLFRDEKELLSDFIPLYQNKFQEHGVQDVVNINKINFEPCGDLVDESYSKFNETLIKTCKAKLKIMRHQGQNILLKFIQKKEKQTKLQLPTLCQKYYQMMITQKVQIP